MLRAFLRENDHICPHDIDVGNPKSTATPLGSAPWLDLMNPTVPEDHFVESLTGVSIPTREEMQEIEVSSRLYSENGAEFMTMSSVVNLDTEKPFLTPITFVLKGATLVTVRYAESRPFSNFIIRAQRTGSVLCASGEQVMMSLIEAMIDRIADALERVGMKIDTLSQEVFHSSNPQSGTVRTKDFQRVITDIGREGELLSMIRESLLSMNRVLTYHVAVNDEDKKAAKEARARVRTVQRDVASLTEHTAYLATKVNFLLDATLGMINLEQNQIIKIFSIAAVCLMPPTLVASLYGMNFKHMPELEWSLGYPMAVTLMVITGVIPFLYFRKKGWL